MNRIALFRHRLIRTGILTDLSSMSSLVVCRGRSLVDGSGRVAVGPKFVDFLAAPGCDFPATISHVQCGLKAMWHPALKSERVGLPVKWRKERALQGPGVHGQHGGQLTASQQVDPRHATRLPSLETSVATYLQHFLSQHPSRCHIVPFINSPNRRPHVLRKPPIVSNFWKYRNDDSAQTAPIRTQSHSSLKTREEDT